MGFTFDIYYLEIRLELARVIVAGEEEERESEVGGKTTREVPVKSYEVGKLGSGVKRGSCGKCKEQQEKDENYTTEN